MTTTITEQVIRDLLKEVYGCEYTGEIKIIELIKNDVPYGMEVQLGMNNKDKPISIACDFLNDEFLNYLRNDLYDRGLNLTSYNAGTRSLKTETMI